MKAKVKFHYSRQCYSVRQSNINATFTSKSMFSQQDTSFRVERSLCDKKNYKVTDDSLAHLNHWKSPIKKILQIQLRRIEKERNRTTLITLLHNKERGILFYSSAPGYNPHRSHPAGLLSPAGRETPGKQPWGCK